MQTIWNRIAQSRCTCNCSSCLSSAAAIARRSTTAAAGRRIRFSDVFTACYSSMLATAAVADSKRKDARREAWDKAIAQAKDELKDLESEQQRRLAALSITPSEEHIITQTEGEHWIDVFHWAAQQKKERKALGFDDWKGVPLHVLQELSTSEIKQALNDSRISSRLRGESGPSAWNTEPHSRPLSPKKLKTLEWSIAKMTLRLMSQISDDGLTTRDGPESVEDTLAQPFLREEQDLSLAISRIDERLSELRNYSQTSEIPEHLESPQYPRYTAGSVRDTNETNSLNRTLHSILDAREQKGGSQNSMLAKVCYNLLISTTAPNVHTYNMLLVKFCHWEQQGLVSALITSMRESHIRPNEITHSTTLKFFTLVENRSAFAKYVRLMEGLDRALAIAHPKTKRIPITEGRYRFPEDHTNSVAQFARGKDGAPIPINCNVDTDKPSCQTKITEKARMNYVVYGALIHGALQFFGKERAMQFYRAMISEGWKPSLTILTSILRHCCYKEDWPSGIAVWQEIQTLYRGASEPAYLWMLRLCRRCQRQNAFEEVLSEGTCRGILPLTVWDLGAQIQTAEVNTLMANARRVQASQGQEEAQRASEKSLKKGFQLKQNCKEKTTQSVKVFESPQTEPRIERVTVPSKFILAKHHTNQATATDTARPAGQFEPNSKDESSSRNAGTQPIALDTGLVHKPASPNNREHIASPQPKTYQGKKQTHKSSSKPPMVYQRPLTPQVVPDQSLWGRVEEPIAATA